MDPFHLWIKTKHDLNTMNDEQFKSIENEILELGGSKLIVIIVTN